jgi:hypothetical protein
MFFTLLEQMYRIKADEQLELISAVSVPHMKKEDAESVVDNLLAVTNDKMNRQEDEDAQGRAAVELLKKRLNGR